MGYSINEPEIKTFSLLEKLSVWKCFDAVHTNLYKREPSYEVSEVLNNKSSCSSSDEILS